MESLIDQFEAFKDNSESAVDTESSHVSFNDILASFHLLSLSLELAPGDLLSLFSEGKCRHLTVNAGCTWSNVLLRGHRWIDQSTEDVLLKNFPFWSSSVDE